MIRFIQTPRAFYLAAFATLLLPISPSRCLPHAPSASAAPATEPAGSLTRDSSVDAVLDVLHDRGVGLKDFTADITLTHEDKSMGDPDTSAGHVWYQLPNPDGARLRVNFDTKTVAGRARPYHREYLLDQGILWDRNFDAKPPVQIKRQVLKPGQKINLLKLGEGPFPLPIGQDKADVHRIFGVEKVAPAKTDPANTVHICLTPQKGTSFARKFHQIDVWVDQTSGMPSRIQTLDADQSDVRTTDLKNLKVNTGVADSDFTLPPIDNTWDKQDESYRD